MTLNLPLSYVLWLEEYCQISRNKNRLPNLWHVSSILVSCIFGNTKKCKWNPPSYISWKWKEHNSSLSLKLSWFIHLKHFSEGLFKECNLDYDGKINDERLWVEYLWYIDARNWQKLHCNSQWSKILYETVLKSSQKAVQK